MLTGLIQRIMKTQKGNEMEERDSILDKARQEADEILKGARMEADRIRKEYAGFVHRQMRLEECLRKEYTLESWHSYDFYSESISGLKSLLNENRKKQREKYTGCPFNAIKFDGPTTDAKMSLGIAGMNLLEASFDRIVRQSIQSGLVHGKQNLMEVIEDIERSVSYSTCKISLSKGYKALKSEELELLYKIDRKKKEEKEQERIRKEQEREEKKAQKEFEKELKKAKADEDKARKALEKAQVEAAKESEDKSVLEELNRKIAMLQAALEEAVERGQRIMSMAQQTRRGWVYVISNIGSFGEGVYKIGLTRRLDPMERIYELGDASVPFPFDVHAFIFSEDAPALETALHQAFEKYKLNSVNCRKEFFRVPLDDIQAKVKELGYDIDFEKYAYAPQYRDSIHIG